MKPTSTITEYEIDKIKVCELKTEPVPSVEVKEIESFATIFSCSHCEFKIDEMSKLRTHTLEQHISLYALM